MISYKGQNLLMAVSSVPSRKLTYHRTKNSSVVPRRPESQAGTQEADKGVWLILETMGSYRRFPSTEGRELHLEGHSGPRRNNGPEQAGSGFRERISKGEGPGWAP